MRDPKLIQLLKTFTAKEMARFVDFVASPFFNKNPTLVVLCEELRNLHPFTAPTTDEELHKMAFPAEVYAYHVFRHKLSDLYALGMVFLTHAHNDNEIAANSQVSTVWAQASGLRSRRLHAQFSKFLAKARKGLDEAKVIDDYTFELRWRLSEEDSLFETLVRPNSNRLILQDQLEELLQMTSIRLLRLYTIMQHEMLSNDVAFRPYLAEDIVRLLRAEEHLASAPVIQTYLAVYELENHRTDAAFQKLAALFHEHRERLDYMDAYMTHLHLTGYCSSQINVEGNEEYFREGWLLMRENIELGYMKENNLLFPDYIYVVRLAGMSGEEAWARDYMKRFTPSLQDDVRDDVVEFSEGFLAMCAGRYSDALRHFSQCSIAAPICNVQVRAYTISCLYKTEMYEQALAACDAFRHYLQKEKSLTEYYTNALKEFTKLVPRLITIKTKPFDKQTAGRLKELEVSAMPTNVFNLRNWLSRAVAD
ncbi:MAG: hypothetical protein SGJ05_03090 [bacterium]|nr:hypothetical protein [bacterium]